MSIFSSRTQKVLVVPFGDEPGTHTVTIRALTGRQLGKAQEASQLQSVEALQRLGGPTFQKELAALGDAAERAAQIERFKTDPLNAYDAYALIGYGLLGWSYEIPVSPEAIEDLSDEAVDFFARAILKLTKPSLFQSAEAAEDARKNG